MTSSSPQWSTIRSFDPAIEFNRTTDGFSACLLSMPTIPFLAFPCCVNVRPRAGVTQAPMPSWAICARPATARRMHLSLFPAVRLAVLLPTLPSERAVTFEATVLPCCFGRDANPRTARRILIRLRARVFYISRQINLGPLGCGPLRERVWHLCRSSSRGARSRSRSALGLRPRLSPRFARPSLRSAAIPFPVSALPAP